jgi:Exonuclease VII, large subunit
MTKRLGPKATLRRGYSMTLDPTGNLVRSVTQVKQGDRIHTRVTDGAIESNVAYPSGLLCFCHVERIRQSGSDRDISKYFLNS